MDASIKTIGGIVGGVFITGVGYAVYVNIRNRIEAGKINEPEYQLAIELNTAIANWWTATSEEKVKEVCKKIYDQKNIEKVNQYYLEKYGETIDEAIQSATGLNQEEKLAALELLKQGTTTIAPTIKTPAAAIAPYLMFPFMAPTIAAFQYFIK